MCLNAALLRIRFQTTYEELKHHPKVFLRGLGMLPDYLWGIETRCLDRLESLSRFQTTYEELKPDPALIWLASMALPDYLWGIETKLRRIFQQARPSFQTTYEELKLYKFLRLDNRYFSFQTTYEELKPRRGTNRITRNTASRLPMRNWNSAIQRLLDSVWCFQTTYEELKLNR